MSAIKLLCVCILLMPIASMIYAQTDWTWAIKAGGTNIEEASSVAVDNQGNTYITGNYMGTAVFGSFSLPNRSSGDRDVFVAKISPTGTFLWAARAGGTYYDIGTAVTVDLAGNVYVTGTFNSNPIYFGATTTMSLARKGSNDVFIAKLDPSGNWLWARRAGASLSDGGEAIAVDSNSNIYVTGVFQGAQTSGSYGTLPPFVGYGYSDIFVTKLDTNGTFLWVTKAGGANSDNVKGLALDSQNNVFLCGSFASDSLNVGTIVLHNSATNNTMDAFVAKLDSSGNWLWARSSVGTAAESAYAIATDSAGNAYVTGFHQSATFGNISLTSYGSYDAYVIKVDGNGNSIWAKTAGGTNWDYGWGVAADGGNVYVTGEFKGTAYFGGTSLNSYTASTSDVFFTSLNSANGEFISAYRTGNSSNDLGKGVAFKDSGVYWYGYFIGSITIGNTTLSSNGGSQDVYVAKQTITQSLSLVSPNGGIGNPYIANSVQPIEWNSMGISQLKLEYVYCDANGALLPDTAVQIAIVNASDGSYQWPIPQITNEHVKVRISNSVNANVTAASDSVFAIYQPIILQTMNGGSNIAYEAGSTQAIHWSSKGVSQVLLDYSLDAGLTWYDITVNPIPASPGEYLWLIPTSTSNAVKVRISDSANSQYNAISSGVFAICPPLVLQSLNGGELYAAASTQEIIWDALNLYQVSLDYSTDAGTSWVPITEAIDASLEDYPWTLPNITCNTVRVRVRDAVDPEICITSASDFAIILPPAAPNAVHVTMSQSNPVDLQISWDEVTTDINQQPIATSGYKIYCCTEPSADINDYMYLDTVYNTTTYTHQGALVLFDNLYYKVIAFKE